MYTNHNAPTVISIINNYTNNISIQTRIISFNFEAVCYSTYNITFNISKYLKDRGFIFK